MTDSHPQPGLLGTEEDIPYAVADHVVKLIITGSLPDGQSTVDPDHAIDGILMALAMIMDQAPECATPRDLRLATENYGKRLHHHAKIFRDYFDKSGVHMIDHVVDRFRRGAAEAVN